MHYQLPYIALETAIAFLSLVIVVRLIAGSKRNLRFGFLRESSQWLDMELTLVPVLAHFDNMRRSWRASEEAKPITWLIGGKRSDYFYAVAFVVGVVTGIGAAVTIAETRIAYATGISDSETDHYSGYVNEAGQHVFGSKYEVVHRFHEGVAVVYRKCGWGYIDNKGNEILAPHYFRVRDFTEGLGAVFFAGGWGFIDRRGATVIAPHFKGAHSFSEGLAAVSIDYRWGYIDHHGNVRVRPQYIAAGEFKGGLARVITEDFKVRYIDRRGHVVWESKGEVNTLTNEIVDE